MTSSAPKPAYPAEDSSVLYGDTELYARLGKIAEGDSAKEVIEQFEIPIRDGKAWVVKKGQLFTLSTPHGPQVGDLNLFSLSNPNERFWASRTRQLHATHVSVGDRMWSNLPYLRPLATIVQDTLSTYGVDEHGGRVHDLLGTRCDPYVNRLLSGNDFGYNCHSNLIRAVQPFGLNESHIHDVLNVFQVTGLTPKGQYFMAASPAKGTENGGPEKLTFFAETDLLCALSTCPGGDLSVHGWGDEKAEKMKSTCRPLAVEVWEVQGSRREEVLRGWRESEASGYKGGHGLA